MTLHEQILDRLAAAYMRGRNRNDSHREGALEQAAEIERWMEWAENIGYARGSRGDIFTVPLTLPPEDWKP